MHSGADTFFGHQEIMGTRPLPAKGHSFKTVASRVEEALKSKGFKAVRYPTQNGFILVVNDAVTVGDNVECDPMQAINVTAALDLIPFDEVMKIGAVVREHCTTPRVIVFGGRGVDLSRLLSAVECPGELSGVNAPLSGVYERDYHCIHLGYGVDSAVQLPSLLCKKGIPVLLLGKVADIVENGGGESYSIVDTDEVFDKTVELMDKHETAFVCLNIQETDLCGHRETAVEYADRLVHADRGIERLMGKMNENDILVVMADHGNDPGIGHPHHTREYVPLLIYRKNGKIGDMGIRNTLSDVAATAAELFGAEYPENGQSFLNKIL